MKKLLLTIIATLFLLPAFGQEDVLFFKGVQLGTDKDNFKSLLVLEEFEFIGDEIEDQIMGFEGRFMGEDCTILLQYTANHKVFKVTVILPGMLSWNSITTEYSKIKAALAEKYGPAIGEVENYEWPYSKGDGMEWNAVKYGKALIATVFNSREHPLTVSIGKSSSSTNMLCIYLSYTHYLLEKSDQALKYEDL